MQPIISPCGRFIAELHRNADAPNPREEFEHLGTILYSSTRYILGDQRDGSVPPDAVSLPMYACIHDGVTLSTLPFCDMYDSAQSGVIYTRRKDAPGMSDAEIESVLRAEVSEFAAWIAGDVFTVTIYAVPDGEDADLVDLDACEVVDSCGDFYGYAAADEAAREMLEEAARQRTEVGNPEN